MALPPPALAAGDRVRVLVRPPIYIRVRGAGPRIVGELADYAPGVSLTIRRTGVRAPWASTVEIVNWADVGAIQIPNGRNTASGLVLGLGTGAGIVLTGAFTCKVFGGSDCMTQSWHWTWRYAVAAVPAGVVWGYLSTRWKRVY
jgi:hypothetical protein